ncbi:MAG: DUF2897 family protein [Aliiglaciecola sp.]|uniref:DUF2897 family protein n=1 Tax=Aliiglaciecola sp. TaxID=1872441 RepID=UPI0032973589
MNFWLIVTLLIALGLIVGNILLLKMSAKMSFEKTKTKPEDEILKSPLNNKEPPATQQDDNDKP